VIQTQKALILLIKDEESQNLEKQMRMEKINKKNWKKIRMMQMIPMVWLGSKLKRKNMI